MVNRETVLLAHHENGAGVLERGDKIVLEVDDEGGVTIALEGSGNGEQTVEESRGRRQANALVSKLMVSQKGCSSYTTPDRSSRRRANQALPNVALQPRQLGWVIRATPVRLAQLGSLRARLSWMLLEGHYRCEAVFPELLLLDRQ